MRKPPSEDPLGWRYLAVSLFAHSDGAGRSLALQTNCNGIMPALYNMYESHDSLLHPMYVCLVGEARLNSDPMANSLKMFRGSHKVVPLQWADQSGGKSIRTPSPRSHANPRASARPGNQNFPKLCKLRTMHKRMARSSPPTMLPIQLQMPMPTPTLKSP